MKSYLPFNKTLPDEATRLFSATPQARGGARLLPAKVLTAVLRQITRRQLTLQPTQSTHLPGPQAGHEYVLYLHVPFCESLCPYCSFNRFLHQEDRTRSYFRNLRKEIQMAADLGYQFQSMYIGGGTPTIQIDELTETIDLAKRLFQMRDVSCETNPNHLTDQILGELQGRVDRLSVGVQSFDDDLLQQMSRYKKFGSGREILARIQHAAGRLPSLNADMIFNFPSQTEEVLRRDVEMVIESGADQTTFYPLMSSPSVAGALQKSVGGVDYNREAYYYQVLSEMLQPIYSPMSAWTFSRKADAMLDEYIVEYGEYVGLGSGSFSYLNGDLYVNTFSLKEYGDLISSGRMAVTQQRSFKKLQQMQYRFMMELFDLKLDKRHFREAFGLPIELGLWKEMAFMYLSGAFQSNPTESILRLNPASRYLMVVMMREFFAGVNLIRDQARLSLAPNERLMCLINNEQTIS